MNKITRKYCSIFADNEIRKRANPNFNITPKDFNQSIKNYHIHYDRYIKKKLGKAKRENEKLNR
jgi:hypothetical protein